MQMYLFFTIRATSPYYEQYLGDNDKIVQKLQLSVEKRAKKYNQS